MKKIIFLLAFLPGLFHAQDLSWGVGANYGLAGVTNGLDYYSVDKNQFYSIRPYLNYRIYKNLRVQLELPLLFTNSEFSTRDYKYTYYYNQNNSWDYNYDLCLVTTNWQRNKIFFSPSLLLEYRFGNISISGGGAFNLLDFGNNSDIISQSVEHFNQWPYVPSYSDQEILSSMYFYNYHYLPLISPVFGLSYHMKSLEVGYRYAIGKHQLTVGYDIGRYRYE
jgi:hypothetical protein